MPCRESFFAAFIALLLVAACSDDAPSSSADADMLADADAVGDAADSNPGDSADASDADLTLDHPFTDVTETDRFELDCLQAPVHVVRTAHDFPHIYAQSATDLQCAHGFVVARDRYVVMELARRLGLTQLSEIIGEPGLALDADNRSWGIERLAGGLYEGILESPFRAEVEAYAEGVNAYVEYAQRGELPLPPLFELAYIVLGVGGPEELLSEWDARAIAGAGATLLWQAGFDGVDVARQRAMDDALEWAAALPESVPDAELRGAGLIDDLIDRVQPAHARISAADWTPPGSAQDQKRLVEGGDDNRRGQQRGQRSGRRALGAPVERGVLDRAHQRLERLDNLVGRSLGAGFGSNAWAATSDVTSDGRALLANDGHLSLTTPTTFFNLHLDNAALGDGDTHVIGVTFPGIPLVVAGTNGRLAWGQTQFLGDLIDWYREELVLEDGVPTGRVTANGTENLVVVEETYTVNRALGSRAGDRTHDRYETADGRPIYSIEGRLVEGPDDDPGALFIAGQWVVPEDVDASGTIDALSVAYAGHFERYALDTYRGFGHSDTVDDFIAHHARSAALGGNYHAADADGDVHYSGFQAMSCRGYLTRDGETGQPVDGADPTLVIDGTRFPSFEVTRADDGRIDPGDDDRTCMLSYEGFPHATSPEQGYVFNGNNDPAGGTFDGDLFDDPVYLGGVSWSNGFRARRIDELLAEGAGTQAHSIETFVAMQNDHQDPLARDLAPALLDALDLAEAHATDGAVDGPDGRLAALWSSDSASLEDARTRLLAWAGGGFEAASGVDTFYHDVPDGAEGDAERADAIATMLFHAWLTALWHGLFDDEGFPASAGLLPDAGRHLYWLIEGRGPGNPASLSSWSATTEESVFFDVVGTDDVETSAEIMVSALLDAFAALEAADEGDGAGGFGSDDPDDWLWGLKHLVRFPSIVTAYIGDSEPTLGALLSGLGLTTDDLPLSDPPPEGDDPRASLTGYPRPGAPRSLDVGGPPVSPNGDYSYSHGPIFRMVLAVGPEGAEGVNVLPGGQSDDPDSDYFGDQAALWVGNETFPLHIELDDVVLNATGRELLLPSE